MRCISFFSLFLYSILFSFGQIADTNDSLKIEQYKLNFGYIGMLSNQADFFLKAGNYEKAISIVEEKITLLRRLYGEENVEYAVSLSELAYYCYNKGDYERAVVLTTKAIKTLEGKGMRESVLYTVISTYLSFFLNNIDEKSNASRYNHDGNRIIKDKLRGLSEEQVVKLPNIYSKYSEDEISHMFRNAFEEYIYNQYDSIEYAVKLFNEETLPSVEAGCYLKAITTIKETVRLLQKWAGDFFDKYTSSLLLLSLYYEKVGCFEDCYKICERLTELSKKYCGESSPEYAVALSHYAFCLYEGAEYMKAIEKEQIAIDISISVKDSIQYATSLSNMGIYHNKLGLIDKALAYEKEALHILESSNKHDAYINTISVLSEIYCQNGDFEDALLLVEKAMGSVSPQSNDYYRLLSNKANCFFYLKDYETAISILEGGLYDKNKQLNRDSLSISQDLEDLSLFYSKTLKLHNAIWYQEKSIEILKKYFGNDNLRIARSFSFLGHLYAMLGDLNKGVQLGEMAAQIIKKIEGENNIDYISTIRRLAYYYKDYRKRLNLLEEAKIIIDRYGIGGSLFFIGIHKELAYCYARIGMVEKVKEIERIMMDNKKNITYFESNKDEYVDYMHTISECYSFLGDYEKSIKIDNSVLEYYKNKYGSNISKYEDKVFNLLRNYAIQSDTANLTKLLEDTKILDYSKGIIKTNIEMLPFKYRKDLWTYRQDIFIDGIPLLASITGNDYLISCAYDISALFSKNILLKNDITLSKLIDNIDDIQIKENYYKYLSDRLKLGLASDKNEEDSLIRLITYQENILRRNLCDLGLLVIKDYSWKDIQSKMRASDLAIEFLCFDTKEYGHFISALLLKKEYDSPKLIKICPVDILKGLSQREQLDSLYLSIWEPIERELENVKDIYFSPAGPIYNLPIEYFQNKDGIYMSEKYNIFRVSSTQRILDDRSVKSYKSSVLFGGLDYDYDKTNVQNTKNNHQLPVDRGLREYLINRNGFDKLINTDEELVEIRKLLSQSKISCLAFTGIYGSEEAFKKLSGRSLDIIHISTHGMFIETDMIKNWENNYPFVKDDISPIQYEDAALSRTFLVMSGGNMLSKHETIPDGMEDGILTAQEIAGMYFKGLDLVVLSACQTALGDIDNEGVYGLQRGFKKAGANTILMSLGNVDDEATKILMVEFYKNLMNGKSKHQSLKDAQKYLRQVDKGKYDKPEYWASFIMLDGLN